MNKNFNLSKFKKDFEEGNSIFILQWRIIEIQFSDAILKIDIDHLSALGYTAIEKLSIFKYPQLIIYGICNPNLKISILGKGGEGRA